MRRSRERSSPQCAHHRSQTHSHPTTGYRWKSLKRLDTKRTFLQQFVFGYSMFNITRQLNIRSSAPQHSLPQSNAHPSRMTPTDRFLCVGLGSDQLACKAFQRKMHHARGRKKHIHVHICRPTFSSFQSASSTQRFRHPVCIFWTVFQPESLARHCSNLEIVHKPILRHTKTCLEHRARPLSLATSTEKPIVAVGTPGLFKGLRALPNYNPNVLSESHRIRPNCNPEIAPEFVLPHSARILLGNNEAFIRLVTPRWQISRCKSSRSDRKFTECPHCIRDISPAEFATT